MKAKLELLGKDFTLHCPLQSIPLSNTNILLDNSRLYSEFSI